LAPEDKRLYTRRVRFEWDPQKANANLRAHGIGFAEAVTVLEDAFALTREDPDAVEEQRLVTLGLSDQANLLVVVYAYREPDIIRLISAARAPRFGDGYPEFAREPLDVRDAEALERPPRGSEVREDAWATGAPKSAMKPSPRRGSRST